MSDYPNFEFYVINQTMNSRGIERFNIFDNWLVSEWVFKYCKKHLRNKKTFTFEQLQEEIRSTIMWQEWSRYEYECSAGPAFSNDLSEFKKIDCYWQAEPNMKVITEMCIKRTREFLKERKNSKVAKNETN